MELPDGTWYAVRSTDIPDMITYELHLEEDDGRSRIGYHTRHVREKHACTFEMFDSSDLLEAAAPLRRFMYREQ